MLDSRYTFIMPTRVQCSKCKYESLVLATFEYSPATIGTDQGWICDRCGQSHWIMDIAHPDDLVDAEDVAIDRTVNDRHD